MPATVNLFNAAVPAVWLMLLSALLIVNTALAPKLTLLENVETPATVSLLRVAVPAV